MRAFRRTRPLRFSPFGAAAVALLLVWPVSTPAQAADPRLDAAQSKRVEVQQRLDAVLDRLDSVQAETARIEDRVAELKAQARSHQRAAADAEDMLAARVRDAYKRGQMPVAFSLLGIDPSGEGAERARLLTVVAARHQTDPEEAVGARLRAAAAAAAVAALVPELTARRAELDTARADVQAALAQARAQEIDVQRTIAAEEQAAREREARQRAARQTRTATAAPAQPAAAPAASGGSSSSSGGSSSGGGGGGGAPVSGGIACPVGSPRSYSDTWGAPRSGGRTHKGTDILAPMGTPSYAYEAGTITRMNGSSLGGISLYMRGNSGNTYYYTHLKGYAASSSVGKKVAAGELIAYVGDTGNAAGIPHLHFEVMPGGGSSVNPYPYVKQACG